LSPTLLNSIHDYLEIVICDNAFETDCRHTSHTPS